MPCKALDWTAPVYIQKILFGRDSYEFIFLRPFPLCSCESNKWSWIKWFSHVSHLTFHRAQVFFTVWLKFPGNSAEIQSGFVNLGSWSCWLPKLRQPGARTAFPIWRTQGASFTVCLCGFASQLQADVSFPEFQVYHPDVDRHIPGENKNSRAVLMMKSSIASSSDLASLILGSSIKLVPWDSTLHMAPLSLEIPSSV